MGPRIEEYIADFEERSCGQQVLASCSTFVAGKCSKSKPECDSGLGDFM